MRYVFTGEQSHRMAASARCLSRFWGRMETLSRRPATNEAIAAELPVRFRRSRFCGRSVVARTLALESVRGDGSNPSGGMNVLGRLALDPDASVLRENRSGIRFVFGEWWNGNTVNFQQWYGCVSFGLVRRGERPTEGNAGLDTGACMVPLSGTGERRELLNRRCEVSAKSHSRFDSCLPNCAVKSAGCRQVVWTATDLCFSQRADWRARVMDEIRSDVQKWTDEQCAALNASQYDRTRHPYTCGNNSNHRVLVATPQGWRCDDCDYRQVWAHV